jgi:uncharacterized protein (UPF0332 family)
VIAVLVAWQLTPQHSPFLLEDGLSYHSHAAVIAAYGKEFARTGRLDAGFHRYLLDAQDMRTVGDYGIAQGVSG